MRARMEGLTDDELLKEITERLKERNQALHDLTGLTRRLESVNEKLLDSEKVKSDFLSNIRNEINNPLTSVLTMCELLAAGGAAHDPENLNMLVRTIYREAFSLNFQLRNIFMAADLESGESDVRACSIDLHYFMKNIADTFQHRIKEKNISVRLESGGEEGALSFTTDAEKLERIVSNLVSNAIEFSDSGASVSIKASREGDMLRIEVADTGIGLSEEEKALIFERFRQLESGPTKRHGGHGLGLSIVKALCELLGGRVLLSSRKGEGSRFTVILPEVAAEDSVSSGDVLFFDSGPAERF